MCWVTLAVCLHFLCVATWQKKVMCLVALVVCLFALFYIWLLGGTVKNWLNFGDDRCLQWASKNTLIVLARPDHSAGNDIRFTFGILTFVLNCLFMHGSWVGQWRTESILAVITLVRSYIHQCISSSCYKPDWSRLRAGAKVCFW